MIMRKPKTNAPRPKITPDRTLKIIRRIEALNETLANAPDSQKPSLRSRLRRLEAHVTTDPAFNQAFDICCELEVEKEGLETAAKSAKPHFENRIRRKEAMITPRKKQKAIDDRRLIVTKCLEYIRQCGAPANITEFINALRREGVLTKTNVDKKSQISDTTVRNILRDIFDMEGQSGRKPRMSK